MSTGDGGEGERPEQDSPADAKGRRSTPRPGNRTPPPRTRSGGTGRKGNVEHRPAGQERKRGSIFGRVLGRQGLDEALQERFKPYEYESTRPMLRWLFLALLLFIAASAYALYADFQFRSQVNDWRDDGLTEIPIDNEDVASASFVIAALAPGDTAEQMCATEEEAVNATPTPDPEKPDATPGPPIGTSVLHQACGALDRVLGHAEAVGIDCATSEQFASVIRDEEGQHPGCDRLVSLSRRYDSLETSSVISTVLIILATIITAFPFSSFAHRSSRNLRTLNSEGQKHSPDGVVIRFFVPIVNIYKPLFMFVEMFKASDPRVPEGDTELWKKKGLVSPIAVIWGLTWGAVLIFNPITAARVFFGGRDDLSDIGRAMTGLIAADILIIVLGVVAILMANTLSKWQDTRSAKHGTVTVVPPRPRDPLEKALEEGVRRQNKENAGRQSGRSKRRKK